MVATRPRGNPRCPLHGCAPHERLGASRRQERGLQVTVASVGSRGRLLEPIGDIPPAEYEMLYWTESGGTDTVGLTELSLH